MGKQNNEYRQENALIDFLYKDNDLINSFYSQMFNGDLTGIAKSEISADQLSAQMNAGVAVLGGKMDAMHSNTENIRQAINPRDAKVIQLIENLNLSKIDLSNTESNSIVAIEGSLLFRSFDFLNKLIPMMNESNMVPQFNEPLIPNTKNKNNKKSYTWGKFIMQFLNMLPYGLEMELKTQSNEQALCILKEEFLTISSTDLLRSYGSTLPGAWTIIGIIDETVQSNLKSENELKNMLDEANKIMTSFILNDKSKIIRPIAIYRKLIF